MVVVIKRIKKKWLTQTKFINAIFAGI